MATIENAATIHSHHMVRNRTCFLVFLDASIRSEKFPDGRKYFQMELSDVRYKTDEFPLRVALLSPLYLPRHFRQIYNFLFRQPQGRVKIHRRLSKCKLVPINEETTVIVISK
ncbi:hypothetical protein WA026_010441 [Henosepilachna vigintioctopunctata]|uniref:CRAL-TRIO domain-containing protein n=1 Tax=Henosepilachna vigintioctopunctata TaxID=420089 RepID=A0AAW1VBH6_9CUCU